MSLSIGLSGLGSRQARVFRLLLDGPLTPTEIADALYWKVPTVLKAIAHLERRQVVEWFDCPEDGASVKVTQYGVAVVNRNPEAWLKKTSSEDVHQC